MGIETVRIAIGTDREIIIQTGKMALLAGGSVTVQQGETMVLVAVCSSQPRPGIDFFPLQVDYRERFSAAGRFPGGYFKREGRPSEKEILTARMTDRPLRPLFPKDFIDEVQVMGSLLSADGENEADVLSMLGASAALMVSDVPFKGPVGAVRVGRVNGQFIANPTHTEMKDSDLDLVYAGVPGKTIMIEGSASEIGEDVLGDALAFADAVVQKLVAAQSDLAARAPKAKKAYTSAHIPEDLLAAAQAFCQERLDAVCLLEDKQARNRGTDAIRSEMVAALSSRFPAGDSGKGPDFKGAFDVVVKQAVRRLILTAGKRGDGRDRLQLRDIEAEAGVLPRTHGSALFRRGETQALVTTTLGSASDAQDYDAITGGESTKQFILHYNFPNFSTGETGRIAGPGRREIGHGALAERCLASMIPDEFPYTVRCVSDILGSNGSSSMASVCGGSLALMDAGVPMKKAVAGISVGLVLDDATGQRVFLTDILGSEDHYGDMDFKVAGTRDGITGFQLDLKIAGLDLQGMRDAMKQNREARMQILDIMDKCLAQPRPEMSRYAPKIHSMKINPEKIGALIGPGGKVIRAITEKSGAQIDVLPDGTVNIFAINADALEIAVREVQGVAAEAEIGRIYRGEVKTVRDFGAFVEILPGQDGLLHVSEMADYRVKSPDEICKVGDIVSVKVIDIDERGRIRLSRKAALAEMQ